METETYPQLLQGMGEGRDIVVGKRKGSLRREGNIQAKGEEQAGHKGGARDKSQGKEVLSIHQNPGDAKQHRPETW